MSRTGVDRGAKRPVCGLRFMLYSHDGLGLGHVRRNLAIAAAVTEAEPEASVLLVTGCTELGAHGLAPNVDVLTVPGLRKLGNGNYSARRLAMSGRDIRALRTAQIEAAVRGFRPDVMLVDKHPLGVREELRPALETLLAAGGRAALGFRDVLDHPATVRREWTATNLTATAQEYFERLLVYGDRSVLDFVQEYRLPASLAVRARYCGYVVHPQATRNLAVDALPGFATRLGHRPTVLATAGGGEDGFALLESFVRSASGAPWNGVVVTGPQLSSSERGALRVRAEAAGVEFHVSVPGVSSWFPHVDALVCMGGYNTLSEAISCGTATVCVPRVQPRREQLIRARSFAGLGLLRVVEPNRLESGALRAAVAAALGADRRRTARRALETLSFDGARRAATELLALAAAPARSRRASGNESSAVRRETAPG
jgi:predicted glycosyltransferase